MAVAALARAAGLEPTPALAVAADVAWRAARAAYPELADDAAAFFAYAGERFGAASEVELARRHIEDLYLAWACDRGDTVALAAFERDVMTTVERQLASFADRHEVLQILRERMLVEREHRRGIAGYDGRAPLATWLRVCATRIGLREQHRARRDEPLDDRHLDQLAPGVPGPELAYLRRLYGASFQTAFTAAVADLTPRDRNLLRLAVIDDLSIDQLAKIFHVHRATAARQLKHARSELVTATHARMRIELSVSASELESIMRMIHTLTDFTLRHVLVRRAQETE
jgi:RNA polymerase sigma-70 factor (ECF subfamily)